MLKERFVRPLSQLALTALLQGEPLQVSALTFSIKKKPVKRAAAFDAVSTLENTVPKFKHGTKFQQPYYLFLQVL